MWEGLRAFWPTRVTEDGGGSGGSSSGKVGQPSLYGVKTQKETVMMNYCNENLKSPVQVLTVASSRQFVLISLLDGH